MYPVPYKIKEVIYMLKVDNVRFEYGLKEVLKGVSLNINKGDRIGLIGSNGTGKTTLLRIIAGELSPSVGSVIGNGLIVGYLPQEPKEHLELSVYDFIKKLTGIMDAEVEFELVSQRTNESEDYLVRLEQSMEKIEHLGSYTFDVRLQKVAQNVGLLPGMLKQSVATLSGGQRKRVMLAAILMSKFDILLLDEPTNDLDLQGIDILEKFFLSTKSAVVIVTHDRRMLRTVTTKIAELLQDGSGIDIYSLGYEEYLKAREARKQSMEDAYERYLDEKKRLKDTSRRLALESVRAEFNKSASDTEKLSRNAVREKAAIRLSATARSAATREDRLVEPPKPPKEIDLRFVFKEHPGMISNILVELKEVIINYPEIVLGPFDFKIERGDRIVIIGPNGSGKTSLLRLILGLEKPTKGTISFGNGVNIGLVDQFKTLPDEEASALENAKKLALESELKNGLKLRTVLHTFNFDEAKLRQSGKSLSPGERARLILAALVSRETNLLLLDEPTNHLDIQAIEELEKALRTYPETFVVVSHDRDFIDSINFNRTLEIIDGRLKQC
jgi:ATPase subunit of ABC transporter with duplicated ATPase domains